METVLIATNLLSMVVLVIGFFIGKIWLKNTVQYAVKHEYDVMLESIKDANLKLNEEQSRQYEIRMKSALIAELMAEWVSPSDDKKKLRQLTNEAFLWLPSDLATELSKVLSHKPDALDFRAFMLRVRKYLQGQDDLLEEFRFIVFPLSAGETSIVNGNDKPKK